MGFGLEPARTVQRDKPPIVVVDPQDAGYPGGFAFISLYLILLILADPRFDTVINGRTRLAIGRLLFGNGPPEKLTKLRPKS